MIGTSFGTLAFLNPWILSGLLFLPALWFLLRVTPPAPRLMYFPPAHILAGLTPQERTPSRTPWWILLLRLLAAALVMIALAAPVLNPGSALPDRGAVRIVMDNSWPGAQTWTAQAAEAEALLKRAARENRAVHIMTTAPEPGKTAPMMQGPMTVAQAEALLRGLAPQPWPADYAAMDTLLKDSRFQDSIHSFWLGHGLSEGAYDLVVKRLQNQGGLTYMTPTESALPLMLRAPAEASVTLAVRVDAPRAIATGVPVTVQAVGGDGRVLDSSSLTLDPSRLPQAVTFDMPANLQAQVAMVRIAGRESAGTVLLTEDRFRNRHVGIVSPENMDDTALLIEATHYIRQALENNAQLQSGPAEKLIEQGASAIILPDIGALPPGTLDELDGWVRQGGLLLRFAGPNMTQGEQYLTPVPLRGGGRALDGALTWEKPVKLAPFPENSPLYGLPIPEDITVSRQILAEPVAGIEKMTWAVLEDGTPLITAAPHDKGLLVMVHTTATPAWSDLALSGLFVKMLQRMVSLSPGTAARSQSGGTLQPVLTLDGRGMLEQPGAHVKPLPAEIPSDIVPDSSHPPGLYGRTGLQAVFNLGDRLPRPAAMPALPGGVTVATYGETVEKDVAPLLLLAALLLFLLDWVLMMAVYAGALWTRLPRRAPAALAAALILSALIASPAHAQSPAPTPQMIEYAAKLHLAYIRSGTPDVDTTAENGLRALAETLTQRTSVEPVGVAAINPETDELAFFPFIYWPVAASAKPLSDTALQKVQYYIDHGGTILVDTRDRLSATGDMSGFAGGGRNAESLRVLLGGLNIPPLAEMKDDHVLSKSFYLLTSFPGRYDGGPLWVEDESASGRDRVSSLIIGSHDWAAAWAAAGGNGPRLSGGAQQQEIALRFGVNVMMYALTGNYKADQVHLPHILERLGQ